MSDLQLFLAELDPAYIVWPIIGAVNIVLGGMFAGMETGTYLLNRVRVELRAEAGSSNARLLRRMLANMRHLLATLLVGVNVHVYLATFAVSAMFIHAGFGHKAEFLTLLTATPILFVCVDSIPKSLFQRSPETLTYRLAWPIHVADLVYRVVGVSYLVRFFGGVVLRLIGRTRAVTPLLGHEGLQAVIAEGHAVGALTQHQQQMTERVMHIAKVHVRDAMIPMESVAAAPVEISREDFLHAIQKHDYSRMPMRTPDGRVVGVIDVYGVLTDEKDQPPRTLMFDPIEVAADRTVTQALFAMQRARRNLAIVVDAAGRHVGIVTIKDLVEEITGELAAW
jgi:CBS domain containing-hemolysin-like protein